MGFWSELGQPPEEGFSNRLLGDGPPPPLPRRGAVLALLAVLALADRAWMAWQWGIICPDTVTYIEVTRDLLRGNFQPFLDEFGLNVYPLMLALFGRLGLDMTTAGEWWSVIISSLAVLPLFGWLRRQFNDPVAAVGCALYAIHPRLVYFSPLVIRDPTFWFLFNLVLYLGWRAVSEVSVRYFLAAGVALALAVHTRSEGWLLLIPLLLWSVGRWFFAGGRRVRLLVGVLLALAMTPSYILLINLTLLNERPRWELLQSRHARMVQAWLQSARQPQGGQPPDQQVWRPDQPVPPATGVLGESPAVRARKLTVRLIKAYTYVYGILAVIGLWKWRRMFFRWDQQSLFLLSVALWLVIWLYYGHLGQFVIRYYFPCLLTAFGYLALALLEIADWITRLTARSVSWSPGQRSGLLLALLGVMLLAGLPDRYPSEREYASRRAELGQWILRECGPNQRFVGCLENLRMVAFFAEGQLLRAGDPDEYRGESLLPILEAARPDIVLLTNEGGDTTYADGWISTLQRHPELPYHRVPADRLPPEWRQTDHPLIMLVRDDLPCAPHD